LPTFLYHAFDYAPGKDFSTEIGGENRFWTKPASPPFTKSAGLCYWFPNLPCRRLPSLRGVRRAAQRGWQPATRPTWKSALPRSRESGNLGPRRRSFLNDAREIVSRRVPGEDGPRRGPWEQVQNSKAPAGAAENRPPFSPLPLPARGARFWKNARPGRHARP